MFNITNEHSSKPTAEKLKDHNTNMTSDEMPVKEFSKNMASYEMPVKHNKQQFQYNTPAKNDHEMMQFKNTGSFLSPTTKQLMQSIEKVSNSVQVLYDQEELKAKHKNILLSVDHILGHDLVKEDLCGATFVTELDKKVQEVKEQFTKLILSICGYQYGKDGELTFPSFENKKNGNILIRDSRVFWVKSVPIAYDLIRKRMLNILLRPMCKLT
jgi:hypothetical protein